MTKIRTAKTSYTVLDVHAPSSGPHALVVKQPSGKSKMLFIRNVGRPRFDAAVSNFRAAAKREREANA